MSYPAGTPYEAQTEEESEHAEDSHPADIQGNLSSEISAESGHPLGDSEGELTLAHLQGGLDIEDDEDREEQVTGRGVNQNADSRRTRWERENEPMQSSFGRAEP